MDMKRKSNFSVKGHHFFTDDDFKRIFDEVIKEKKYKAGKKPNPE